MLPNHPPLVIAEQFGTLATLHPGRIELGLGRAPGSDQATTYALRRNPASAESFPRDVVELQGLFGDESPIPGVRAIPGQGTHVPLYMLGSSLFGAQLAAELGLPYAFASQFAPHALHEAVAVYREKFKPSQQLNEPYVIAGVGAIVAETAEAAAGQLEVARRLRARALFSRGGQKLSEDDIDAILSAPESSAVDEMLTYNAVGTADEAGEYLERFLDHADADELIVVHQSDSVENRLRSVELLAEAVDPTGGDEPGKPRPASRSGD
jgi:luciferase family oxidoreductase group 1